MSATVLPAKTLGDDRVVIIPRITWDAYAAIGDAIPDPRGLRMVFVEGRLTFSTVSRRHEWYAEAIAELFKAVVFGCGIEWEGSGSATYRSREIGVGVEGDKVYYPRENARIMAGPTEIDLSTHPQPDLAFEVEVSHPAEDAMLVYGRLGMPEVWRLDVDDWTLRFCLRNADGSYSDADRSLGLPSLESSEILDQLRIAETMVTSDRLRQLHRWVGDVALPRVVPEG